MSKRSEAQKNVSRTNSQQQRRNAVIYSGLAESTFYRVTEHALDERLSYRRSIIREIERDGCVGGELS
jgi:hypothetical protein